MTLKPGPGPGPGAGLAWATGRPGLGQGLRRGRSRVGAGTDLPHRAGPVRIAAEVVPAQAGRCTVALHVGRGKRVWRGLRPRLAGAAGDGAGQLTTVQRAVAHQHPPFADGGASDPCMRGQRVALWVGGGAAETEQHPVSGGGRSGRAIGRVMVSGCAGCWAHCR